MCVSRVQYAIKMSQRHNGSTSSHAGCVCLLHAHMVLWRPVANHVIKTRHTALTNDLRLIEDDASSRAMPSLTYVLVTCLLVRPPQLDGDSHDAVRRGAPLPHPPLSQQLASYTLQQQSGARGHAGAPIDPTGCAYMSATRRGGWWTHCVRLVTVLLTIDTTPERSGASTCPRVPRAPRASARAPP